MSVTIERANELYVEEIIKALEAGLPIHDDVTSNPVLQFDRKRTVLGHCMCRLTNNIKSNVRIFLSKYMLDTNEQEIRQVLAHELCHACERGKGHDEYFYHYARMLELAYGYNINRLASAESSKLFREASGYAKKTNYQVKCDGCGQLISRNRMCKIIAHPENYACGRCGGKFHPVTS